MTQKCVPPYVSALAFAFLANCGLLVVVTSDQKFRYFVFIIFFMEKFVLHMFVFDIRYYYAYWQMRQRKKYNFFFCNQIFLLCFKIEDILFCSENVSRKNIFSVL